MSNATCCFAGDAALWRIHKLRIAIFGFRRIAFGNGVLSNVFVKYEKLA